MKRLFALLLAAALLCALLPALAEGEIAGTWVMTRYVVGDEMIDDPESRGSRKIIVFGADGSAVVTINQNVYQASWSLTAEGLLLVYEDGDRAVFQVQPERLVYEVGNQIQVFTRKIVYADAADFKYRTLSDTEARVIAYLGQDSVVNVPQELGAYTARAIDRAAFTSQAGIVNVTLPKTVTAVEEWAFARCDNLAGVTFGKNVRKIGRNAFYRCVRLAGVSLPDGLERIEAQCFADCARLSAVSIPASVRVVELGAFSGCAALTEIVLPEGVETLADLAFADCRSLRAVSLPASLTWIGGNPFAGCDAALVITAPADSYAASWCEAQGINVRLIQ